MKYSIYLLVAFCLALSGCRTSHQLNIPLQPPDDWRLFVTATSEGKEDSDSESRTVISLLSYSRYVGCHHDADGVGTKDTSALYMLPQSSINELYSLTRSLLGDFRYPDAWQKSNTEDSIQIELFIYNRGLASSYYNIASGDSELPEDLIDIIGLLEEYLPADYKYNISSYIK